MTTSRISAVIVNYNGGADLIACVASLTVQAGVADLEIVVVDNASTDGSLEEASRQFPDLVVVASETNEGFPAGANRGAEKASGDVIVFLNPDVVMDPGCLAAMTAALRSGLAITGPALWVEAAGRLEYGLVTDWVGFPLELTEPQEPLFVPGCALATHRETFDHLGGFDARYFAFGEDLDFCWRALVAGGEVGIAPGARAIHRGGASTPGGYLRGGRREVTNFRIAMRERNVLATRIKCLPARWLVPGIAAEVAWILGVAAGSSAMGRFGLAADLIGGLAWNVRNLPETARYRQRASSPRGRVGAIRGRIHRGMTGLTYLRRNGPPRFVG
jgi:N-acetylglucosaminyl-diphospho-decaprenol L-rhamnosyltransferase